MYIKLWNDAISKTKNVGGFEGDKPWVRYVELCKNVGFRCGLSEFFRLPGCFAA
jgi:hypothetical protein